MTSYYNEIGKSRKLSRVYIFRKYDLHKFHRLDSIIGSYYALRKRHGGIRGAFAWARY